jgi:hypothetical protein
MNTFCAIKYLFNLAQSLYILLKYSMVPAISSKQVLSGSVKYSKHILNLKSGLSDQ